MADSITGGTYLIRLSDTHYYVGRTTNFKVRWRGHLRALLRGDHPNPHVAAVYAIHHRFEPEVLAVISPEEAGLLLAAEQVLLDAHVGRTGCLNISQDSVGPMKGRSFPESGRLKLRGRKASEKTRQLLSEMRKGHPVTLETRTRLSSSLRGKKRPDMAARNVASAGWRHTEEARAKISDSNRNRTYLPRTEETKDKIRLTLTGRTQSEETIRKRSLSLKATWAKRRGQK
jgi:hypothetical protein